jgi:hypothetical protein
MTPQRIGETMRDVLAMLFWPMYLIAIVAVGLWAWRAWPWW